MPPTAPIIVLGAGHNGLTAAAYLANRGQPVLVFEKRDHPGGIAATEPLIPGFRFNTGFADISGIPTDIIKDLRLESNGLEPLHPSTALAVLGPTGPVAIDASGGTRTGGERLGDDDEPGRLAALVGRLESYGGLISRLMGLTPPNVKGPLGAGEVLPWARLGLDVRRMGGREMTDLLRILPMSVREFLDECLTSERLKGSLAVFASLGAFLGPYGSGSALNLLYRFAGGFGPVFARGGAGALAEALRAAVVASGGEIRTGMGVREIVVADGRAAGVVTDSGEHIEAAAVISSLDPHTTFCSLLEPGLLPVKFSRRVDRIRFKGSTATVHFALDRIPDFGLDPEHLDGWITICPSVSYLERAYDDAKYGRISSQPALLAAIPSLKDSGLAPPGRHTLTALVRYAPYHLREGGYDRLPDLVMQTLGEHAPGFKDAVADYRMITPHDYETHYSLTEGAWMHGQMGLDQQLIMRPVPGWSGYRSPVPGLWLCGSGSHPGGGITCAPGRNAAREILKGG